MQHARNSSLIPVLLLMSSFAIADDFENPKELPEASVEEETVLDLNAFEKGGVLCCFANIGIVRTNPLVQ